MRKLDLTDEERRLRKLQQQRAALKRHYAKHRARVLAAQSRYRKTHPEKIKEKTKRYYAANKDRVKIKNNLWVKNNPEKMRAIDRRWKAANREKIAIAGASRRANNAAIYRERSKKRWALHSERMKARYREWQKDNLALMAAHAAARRALRRKAMPAWVDKEVIKTIYLEAGRRGLTVDHIIPLKHPLVCGLHVPWNLQLLTLEENARKHNNLPDWAL